MSCDEELFSIKQGVLLPSPEFILTVPDGTDLTTASQLALIWRPKGSTSRTSVPFALVDPVTNLVLVNLTPDMVAAVGLYEFQFEATFAGQLLVIPDEDFYVYRVTPTI